MRNPLKRRPRDATKPTLRERLAATKAKYTRTLAVHRALNAPLPAPAVDRAALVNYSTWLSFERVRVCAELYPHMGAKASRFVLTMNAAERFFYPDGIGDFRSQAWRDVPPASTRAVKVLDLVGVDWRQDTDEQSRQHFEEGDRADMGERPPVPHGWPRIDAALLEALDDLARLDAAQVAMGKVGSDDRDIDTVPGYGDLEYARGDALGRLAKIEAESAIGLQAKAKALLTGSVSNTGGPEFEGIAASLARDLLGIGRQGLKPEPDPIFAAIEACEDLGRTSDAEYAKGNDGSATAAQTVSVAAVGAFWRDVVLKTVPTTGAGCAALARFASGYLDCWGTSLDRDAADSSAVLALIARSPLL